MTFTQAEIDYLATQRLGLATPSRTVPSRSARSAFTTTSSSA